jgi:hypothetical protein
LQRIAQAREQAARLRAIVQADHPVVGPAPPGHTGRPTVAS